MSDVRWYEAYETIKSVDEDEGDDKLKDEDEDEKSNFDQLHKDDRNCVYCFSCLNKILHDLTSMSGLFNNLYAATKFLVTLPCTQVTCERCFSKLKKLEDCSRTSLSQDLLSSLLLIFV